MAPLCTRRAAVMLAALVAAAAARGQGPPAKEAAQPERGKWASVFTRHADETNVQVGATVRAVRLAEPVLRWWQPVRGGDDGALYLWTADGKPVAAITFFTFKWPDGNRAIVHERHSLSEQPVEASWRGATAWRSPRLGVTFRPVPGAPAPAATAPARLRQMQAIIRDVSASTTDDKESNWPLRPLTKPLYRNDNAADGALFALAQGTDPEAFVILEVRPDGSGNSRWEIAVARFTDLKIRVLHQGREIFSSPNSTGRADDVYYSNTVLQKPSENPDDFR